MESSGRRRNHIKPSSPTDMETILDPLMLKGLFKFWFNFWYKIKPPEMVQYWKTGDKAKAKVVHAPDGSLRMAILGEKYLYPGFPRAHVLLYILARFKKVLKQTVFNDTWELLNQGKSPDDIMYHIKTKVIPVLIQEVTICRYDILPPEKCMPAVREVHRAMSAVSANLPTGQKEIFNYLRDGLTFFLQEDDAYRFRLQWAAPYINPRNPLRRLFYLVTFRQYSLVSEFNLMFRLIKNAEVVADMKGRIELIKVVTLAVLGDQVFRSWIEQVMKEIKWQRLYLDKADKYYFRGKYYKVDHGHFDY